MLKRLMLNKKLEELIAKEKELETRSNELKKREEDLAEAIEEMATDEEKTVVEEEVEKFEKDKEDLDQEKEELTDEIQSIEKELEELEDKNPTEREEQKPQEEEKREMKFEKRDFRASEVIKRDDVKEFLTRTRELALQTRAVKGGDLLIPEVLIGILRENIGEYSKLIKRVNLRKVKGTSRTIIPGSIPEGIWVEACEALKELDINFNDMEVDGYKVGGYVPICNSTLKDASDLDLYNEIMTMLAASIGFAVDKAILYGTGEKMPVGIVTRLAETQEPSNRRATARKWENLSATNILKVAGTDGKKFFADLILKMGALKSKHSKGEKFWAMSETIYTMLLSKVVEFDSSGAIVASVNNTMPIIGGDIEKLDFIPDGDIIGGYGDMYVLAEREGIVLESSNHVQFIEDNTVFKGLARYDGTPAIPESFVALNINGGTVTKKVDFNKGKEEAEDKTATA